MDIKKFSEDFEKRFSAKCEKICFAGMTLPVLKGEGYSLCGALSVGGYAAIAHRADGRITIEFEDNKKYIRANVIDLFKHKKEPMIEFLTRVEAFGSSAGGADILLEYNTDICDDYEALLLTSMYFFCNNMPPADIAAECLSEPRRDFVSFSGMKNAFLFCGEKKVYIKFCDSTAKIVICRAKGRNCINTCNDKTVEFAARMLANGDYLKFGEIITAEYAKTAGDGINRETSRLFELAVKLKDAFGCGILESGGIFALVENRKIDAFIQNLKREYETYYGAAPDFYVTRTENSGVCGLF